MLQCNVSTLGVWIAFNMGKYQESSARCDRHDVKVPPHPSQNLKKWG
ncbi:hypothetical protein [Nostoc sp.]